MQSPEQEAQDPKTSQERLAALAAHSAQEVRAQVAQNPNTPLATLLTLAPQLPREVSQNASLSLALLESPQLIQSLSQEAAFAFALCEDAPEWLLELLLTHPKKELATLLSYRKTLSERMLWRLSQSAQTADKILAHPNCPEELWEKIAMSSLQSKLFAARAKNLPPKVQALLAQDPEPQLQAALRLRQEESIRDTLPPLRYQGGTDVGVKRNHNEDAFAVYQGDSIALFVVADGMGGQSTGYIASEAICAFFEESAKQAEGQDINAQAFLHQAFTDSYQEIGSAARRSSYTNLYVGEHLLSIGGMGAAAVALLLQGYTATIAHAGDSRAYLLREGQLTQLTEDHSLLNDYIKAGLSLSQQEVDDFPHKNIITRALGMGVLPSTPEITRLQVSPGDLLLLCSDGLNKMVKDEEVRLVLCKANTLRVKVLELIAMANQAGGEDNITALLIAIA